MALEICKTNPTLFLGQHISYFDACLLTSKYLQKPRSIYLQAWGVQSRHLSDNINNKMQPFSPELSKIKYIITQQQWENLDSL